MKRTLLGIIALAYAATSLASSSNGPIFPSFVTANSNGVTFAWFQGTRTGTVPSCAVDHGGFFVYAFDSTTGGGKSMLSILLAANAGGHSVWVMGDGTCSADSASETLTQVESNP